MSALRRLLSNWPSVLPLPEISISLIVVTFLLLGLIGHDPWKPDDAIHLGIAYGFSNGNWLIPTLAGEPWFTTPPLFHWAASFFGNSLSLILPWHDGARLASLFFMLIGLGALYQACQQFLDRNAARVAPLLVVGTVGLLAPVHNAHTSLVGFTAISLQLAGLAYWQHSPYRAAITLGAGLGIGFMGGGLGLALPMLTLLLAALTHREWRCQPRAWLLMAITAAPWLLIWPGVLANQEFSLFERWWNFELRSLSGGSALGIKRFELLAWASWPLLPLALWMLWLERRRLHLAQSFIAFSAVAILFIFFLRQGDSNQALPALLAALTLPATGGVGRLRRGAANAFDWFGSMTLTLFMGLIWLGGIAILTGLPERVAKNFTKPAPGFIPEWSWWAWSIAILVSLGWLRLLVAAPRSPWRAATRWSLGVAVLWVLLATLWLPWIDYGKTYRGVAAELRHSLGPEPGCIERRGLGPAQRASLDYFEGIRTVAGDNSGCNFRLVQVRPKEATPQPGWRLILNASRPGDRTEELRLYRRAE
jgi:4-amino-4-deoxy-L-arabinose transferase-like glycosyltransferase